MTEGRAESKTDPVNPAAVRVALIASEDTLFRYSVLLRHMLSGLADQAAQMVLVCPHNGESFSENLKVIKHPAVEIPLMNYQNHKILVEELEKFKPTILHCLCQSKLKLTVQLAGHFDIPYAVSINSFQNRLSKVTISARHLAKIITPSQSIAANVSKVWHKYSDRLVQVNPGISVTENQRETGAGQIPTIVTVNLGENADEFESLLNAVRHLYIDGQEFMFVLISCRLAAGRFRRLIVSLGLSDVVTVVERPKPWPSIVSAADIFVQARPVYQFNPFLLQAMSGGAAVAGCSGGVDDLIEDGQTALIFDPDDELSIYSVLQRLLDSRELSRKLAKTAKDRLLENHKISTMTAKLLEIYCQETLKEITVSRSL